MKNFSYYLLLSIFHAYKKIKEGIGWFSYMHGKYSEVSSMKNFSESIELPKADVLDEVGAIIERQGFRAAKRGQQ